MRVVFKSKLKRYYPVMITALVVLTVLIAFLAFLEINLRRRREALVELTGMYVKGGELVLLPFPKLEGEVSVEEAIASRRSIRSYQDQPLSLEQLSQLLWAAQGITYPRRGFRAAPSAGALYPLEVYVVVGHRGVQGLEAGVYHYIPQAHALELIKKGDFRKDLCRACLGQPWVENAPISIVIVAIYERTTSVYGERGIRYIHIEVGHVGQNIYLQAVSLGLGTVAVGAFHDEEVMKVIGCSEVEKPLYVMPVGWPKVTYKPTLEELVE